MNVAVMNTGNRQVALTDAEIYLVQIDGIERLRQPLRNTMITTAGTSLPLLIEPGKMVVFALRAEADWGAVRAYRQAIEPGDDHTHRTEMGLQLGGLGATGAAIGGVLDAVKIQLRDETFGGYSLDRSVSLLQSQRPRMVTEKRAR